MFEETFSSFFFTCKQGLYDLDISSFVTFSSNLAPVQVRTTCFKSIRAKPLLLETLFLTELSFYGTISLQSFVTVRLFHPLSSSSIPTTLLN
jgi:hypothetical protein